MTFKGIFIGNDEEKNLKKIDLNNLPTHVAIIMDGNGRWARNKLLPRTAGHREGANRVREIIEACGDLGIEYLTLYAFSTENWKRPMEEVNYLMKLLLEFLRAEIDTLHKNNIKLSIFGDIDRLNETIKNEIIEAMEKTKNNSKLKLNIALNYGSRDEIVRATKLIIEDVTNENINVDDINEELIGNYLYTSKQPDPDLLIRTSGELRISNFLLYQIAYTEFWFTSINWPNFKKEHFYKAIIDYQKRNKRFGKV